jgi:hypothetical protein
MTPEQAIKQGLYVFPTRWGYSKKAKKETHIPLIRWGTESTDDPTVVAGWREKWPDCYFCVAAVKSGITIYDIDDKNGKSGSNTSALHEMEHGTLPATMRVKTPSGGLHLYYKGSTRTGTNRFGEGVDSAVMCPLPGSVVSGKGTYELLSGGGDALAELPQWCHDMAGKAKVQEERDDTCSTEHLDAPLAVAQAATYFQTAPPAIEGEGGDDTAYRVFCTARDMGLSEKVCADLAIQYYMSRCVPGDPDWIRDKVHNVYRYAERPLSDSDVSSGFGVVEMDGPPPAVDHNDMMVGWDDLLVRPMPREWIVPGLIPKGEVTAFYGDGASGKSLLALQLVMAVNGGGENDKRIDQETGFDQCIEPTITKVIPDVDVNYNNSYNSNVLWLNHFVRPCLTLYVSCEDDKEELKRRGFAVMESVGSGASSVPLRLWSRAGEGNLLAVSGRQKMERGPFYTTLVDVLNGMGDGHKLVVLDTISDVFGGDENDRANVSQFIKEFLKGLCIRHNCTILLIGHTNKQGQVSGSTGWLNACRSQLQLARHENTNMANYRRLWTGKANYAASGDATGQVVEWRDGVFHVAREDEMVDETFQIDMDLMMAAIVEQARKNQPYGQHHAAILYIHGNIQRTDGTMIDKDTSKRLLAQLIKDGDVQVVKGMKDGNGIWPV